MSAGPGRRIALIPPALALAWGLNWPAVKIMLTTLPPYLLRGVGLGGGAVLLLAAILAGRRARPLRQDWPGIALGGFLNVAVFKLCTALAQLNTSTSRAAAPTFTMPMMTALLAWGLLGGRLNRRSAAALALGSAGIAILASPATPGQPQSLDRPRRIGNSNAFAPKDPRQCA